MKFKKGHKKTGGKKAGTPNKITKDAKELFVKIMEGQVSNIEGALDDLLNTNSEKYLTCLSKLMPYFMPKQIDLKSDGAKLEPPVIQILNVTEE